VPGKAETVGAVEVVHHEDRALRIVARAVHALEGELLLARDPIEFCAAVWRIAEIDSAVAGADDVVRTVELLILIVRGDRRDAAVGPRARHLARRMPAGEQPPLPVPGEPVRHIARLAIGGDAVPGRPPPEMIARHVAPEKVMLGRVPQRTFGEEAAG